jgi:hypothetical protein
MQNFSRNQRASENDATVAKLGWEMVGSAPIDNRENRGPDFSWIDQGDQKAVSSIVMVACQPWPGARTAAHHRASSGLVSPMLMLTLK